MRRCSPEGKLAEGVSMSKKAKAANNLPNKSFIIDTNVLLHDPSSLFRFEEHEI